MKKAPFLYIILLCTIFYLSCKDDMEVVIPNFDYPQSVTFEQNLSDYNIFEGSLFELIPTEDFHLLELSSALFTDYANKQRLIKLPAGTQLENLDNNSIDFPDKTILVKTFFYYLDERDTSLGKEVIETRLMVKDSGIWNVATYIWNTDQQDATLLLTGSDKEVSWVDSEGVSNSTLYHIPDENECTACHQSDATITRISEKEPAFAIVQKYFRCKTVEEVQSGSFFENWKTLGGEEVGLF